MNAGGGPRPLRTAARSRGRPEEPPRGRCGPAAEGGRRRRLAAAAATVGHVGGPPVRPEDVPGFASRTGTLEGRPCGPKACFDRDTHGHAEGSPVRPAGVSGLAFLEMHLYF